MLNEVSESVHAVVMGNRHVCTARVMLHGVSNSLNVVFLRIHSTLGNRYSWEIFSLRSH